MGPRLVFSVFFRRQKMSIVTAHALFLIREIGSGGCFQRQTGRVRLPIRAGADALVNALRTAPYSVVAFDVHQVPARPLHIQVKNGKLAADTIRLVVRAALTTGVRRGPIQTHLADVRDAVVFVVELAGMPGRLHIQRSLWWC